MHPNFPIDEIRPSTDGEKYPQALILFVDGDNTLRRRPNGYAPEGLPALQEALRRPAQSSVLTVAFGQWREVLSLQRIRAFFDEDIAERIIDVALQLPEGSGFRPHEKIFAWLSDHPEVSTYGVVEPFWPVQPNVESAVFIENGKVFAKHPRDVEYLEDAFGRGKLSS